MLKRFPLQVFVVACFLLLTPFLNQLSATPPRVGEIVGGIEATPGSWPFMTAILDSDNNQFCGGSLIASRWVLSAAHCFVENGSQTPASGVRVAPGAYRLSTDSSSSIQVVRIIVHPSYDAQSSDNDIALLELATDSSATPVTLNFGLTSLDGNLATVMGFGTTISGDGNSSPDVLRQVDVPIVSSTTCQQSYPELTSNMLCAGYAEGGRDSCQGDSGGPLVVVNGSTTTQVGVVSFGQGCAEPLFYGVYAKVSNYESFISQYVTLARTDPTDGDFGVWTGYLNITNIIELRNAAAQAVTAQVNLFSITGDLVSSSYFAVAASSQQDVIINSLPGFTVNSYGIIQVSSNVDGRILYYRATDAVFENFDFAFGIPLAAPRTGTSYVGFNTFQPSFNFGDQANLVANWLAIVNLSDTSANFIVRKYNSVGTLLSESTETVAPKGRKDVDGGHVFPGVSNVGLIQIVPASNQTEYLAQLVRYGYGPNNSFEFAFPLIADDGSTSQVGVPLGSSLQAQNWLEVVNPAAVENTITVNFYSSSGSLVSSQGVTLPARAQQHINVNSILGDQQLGFATLQGSGSNPVLAQSMFYYRTASGSISAMYGSQADLADGQQANGSFNRYLGMENYLKVANPNSTTSTFELRVTSAFSAGSSRTIQLPGNSSIELSLHDDATYGTVSNSYGVVSVIPSSSTLPLIHEILRLKRTTLGEVQFAAPTTLD